jgi:peroxiredoxin
MQWHEAGIPRRVSYLIDPDGKIAVAYDLEASEVELGEHSAQILADITALT